MRVAVALEAHVFSRCYQAAGCPRDRGPVMTEDQLGGPEPCELIYTDKYLEMNWSSQTTAINGDTPVEKCMSEPGCS